MAIQLLHVWDYVIIVLLLALSAAYGLYHGCYRAGPSTFIEYTLASRSVSVLPIALSAFATLVGSGLMVGSPAETYMYGTQPTFLALAALIIIPVMSHIVIPIYRNLSCTSIFQFFELRYSVGFKNLITVFFLFTAIGFCSMTMYGPATVLSLVTGVNVWYVVLVMDCLCLVYTILGGMRAVIYADVIQGIFMLVTIIGLVILGCIQVGGAGEVWNRTLQGNRIEFFNLSLDPTVRHTVWTSVVGWAVCSIAFMTSNQAIIQRYLSTETLEQAQKANVVANLLAAVGQLFAFLAGIVAFAIYHKCDPWTKGELKNLNQLLPLIVMETFGSYPGFPGLYFTGLLSASLSTVSSLINSLSSVTIESFVRPYFPKISEKSYTKYCKFLSLFYGLFSLLGVFIIQMFPNVLQAATVIAGAITGPTFGTMLVGMLFPQTNKKASMGAFGVGVGLCLWTMVGGLQGHFDEMPRPFSVKGCDAGANVTSHNITQLIVTTVVTNLTSDDPRSPNHWTKTAFPLSTMSYMWVATFGVGVSALITLLTTFVFGAEDAATCHPQFVPPVIQRLHKRLSAEWKKRLYCDIYSYECACAVNGDLLPETISPLIMEYPSPLYDQASQ